MLVFVKFLTGKTVTVDGIKENNLVEDLKNEVFKSEGIPTDQQRYVELKTPKMFVSGGDITD